MTSEMPPTIIESVVYFFYVDRNVLYSFVMVDSRALMSLLHEHILSSSTIFCYLLLLF